MKFSKILGKIDPNLIAKAEEKLSAVFLELGTKYDNTHVGTGLGGDSVIFSLMYPVKQFATLAMPTAATDGKCFYWNPNFILKQSKIGLRIICAHEAWHALYLHPSRRGSRNPKLWNIAVDYIVNGQCMEDFKARKKDPKEMFEKHLGKFMTLSQYCELLKNPFKGMPGFEEELKTQPTDPNAPVVNLPSPDEDRELTEAEIKELERREKQPKFYFADPDLADDMKRPEKIYDLLYSLLPKCPDCGRIGIYKRPKKDKAGGDQKGQKASDKGKDKGDKGNKDQKGKDKSESGENGEGQGEKDPNQPHDHGDGQPCDCKDHGDQPGQGEGQGQGDQENDQDGKGQGQGSGSGKDQCDHGCPSCGSGEDGIDVFDLGGLVDDHMDTTESEEKLAKRISDAVESAKKMAGSIPGALEDELGLLTAPKISWQDLIRTRLKRSREGNSRNDWTRFRSRPMSSGQMVPKKKSSFAKAGCLLDTSGSMSKDDMAFGISQLQSLDERSEITITSCDCTVYWDDTVLIKKCSAEELSSKVKPQGRGGTALFSYFQEYEEHIGKCDFLIVITDGFLTDQDIATIYDPGIPTYWLITSGHSSFEPGFGKVLQLR